MVNFDVIKNMKQATKYFNLELVTYYNNAHFGGKLRSRLGINSQQPLRDVYMDILRNKHPQTGEKMRPNKSERLLISFCFSAPKPLSIIAIYTDDDRLYNAHNAAVAETAEFLERFAGVRKRRNNRTDTVKTGETLYFICDHKLSRCNDPQIHTHVVFFNLTWDDELQSYRALDPGEMGTVVPIAIQIYRNILVRNLCEIGVPAKIAANGEVEIDGISKELCEKYSKRKKEIEEIVTQYETKHAGDGRKCGKKFRAKIANIHKDPKCSPAMENYYIDKFKDEIIDLNYAGKLWKIMQPEKPSLFDLLFHKRPKTPARTPEEILIATDKKVPMDDKIEYWKQAIIEARGEASYKELFAAHRQRIKNRGIKNTTPSAPVQKQKVQIINTPNKPQAATKAPNTREQIVQATPINEQPQIRIQPKAIPKPAQFGQMRCLPQVRTPPKPIAKPPPRIEQEKKDISDDRNTNYISYDFDR